MAFRKNGILWTLLAGRGGGEGPAWSGSGVQRQRVWETGENQFDRDRAANGDGEVGGRG